MVYYGKGFTWTELYDMPIWLRKFYYKKTLEALNALKGSEPDPKKSKISKPNIALKK